MARLPSGRFLIQHIEPEVILFQEHPERELVRFDPDDVESLKAGLVAITNADMPVEDVTYALFWSGYFFAYARITGGGIRETANRSFKPAGVIGGRFTSAPHFHESEPAQERDKK